jgi:hypothetical protein
MGDDISGQARRVAAGEGSGPEPGGLSTWLHMPSITAGIGVIVGLGLGIIVGRATVSPGSEHESALELRSAAKGDHSKGHATKDDDESQDDEGKPQKPQREPETLPEDEFRLQVGRRLPEGKRGSGFEHHRIAGRATASLTPANVLQFDVEPSEAKYVVLAVLGLEGEKGAVDPKLDGRSLGAWTLTQGWSVYSAPVPKDLLGKNGHELKLAPDAVGGAVVSVDAVAVVPVRSEVDFAMGEESVGHLVEGFANRSGRSVWSLGPRSVVGVALAPAAGSYRLTVRGTALPTLSPLSVACKVNGKDVGSAEFERKGSSSSWAVPANALRAGANRIEFTYAKTAVPSELDPKSADQRELALRFSELSLVPQ